MSFCKECTDFGHGCTLLPQIRKQAKYLEEKKFQNPEWYDGFENTLNNAENHGCLDENLPSVISDGRAKLAEARLNHPGTGSISYPDQTT